MYINIENNFQTHAVMEMTDDTKSDIKTDISARGTALTHLYIKK